MEIPPGTMLVRKGENKFIVRKNTCDEEVISPHYARMRFFPPGYRHRDRDIICDVGAHIGVFAVAAARKAWRGRVYALEPDRENFDLLTRNLELNGIAHVVTCQTALSNRRGTATLYRQKENWGHSLLKSTNPSSQVDADVVATNSLTGFMANNRISRIDYLKMNVEGAEYRVLLGASRQTLRKIRCMLIEFHPSETHVSDELVRRLRDCGFATTAVRSNEEAGKGWLVARYPS